MVGASTQLTFFLGDPSMFGTIMRAHVKPGQREAFEAQMRSRGTAEDNPGFLSAELAYEDKDSDRVIAVIRFRDRESYLANAQRPQTDAEYQSMLVHLVEPPEWVDVHYTHFAGEPRTETATAAAAS
jgi:heme-degrading monooxygenase HmoA